jgi:hypothetical protein
MMSDMPDDAEVILYRLISHGTEVHIVREDAGRRALCRREFYGEASGLYTAADLSTMKLAETGKTFCPECASAFDNRK